MTNDEVRVFFKECLFAAFPSVGVWIEETSSNPVATREMWAKTLEKITFDEAKEVIDIWATGSDPRNKPPEAYQRDGFALHIRNCALEKRSRRNAEQAAKEEQRRAEHAGTSIIGRIEGTRIWQDEWLPRRAAILAGELRREDGLAQWNAIVDAECEKARRANRPPF